MNAKHSLDCLFGADFVSLSDSDADQTSFRNHLFNFGLVDDNGIDNEWFFCCCCCPNVLV